MRAEVRKPPVKPAREKFTSAEFRVAQNARKSAALVLIPVAVYSASARCRPRDSLGAVAPPRDEFSEQRVIFGRDRKAFVDSIVETNART